MITWYKAKATTAEGQDIEHDTMNLDQAKYWCGRWVNDGRCNVRMTVITAETFWGPQTSRTYRWIHDIQELGGEIR